MTTIYKDFTMHELMSVQHEVTVKKIGKNHIKLTIHNEDGVKVYSEEMHIYAWDELVSFCNQVVHENNRKQNEL